MAVKKRKDGKAKNEKPKKDLESGQTKQTPKNGEDCDTFLVCLLRHEACRYQLIINVLGASSLVAPQKTLSTTEATERVEIITIPVSTTTSGLLNSLSLFV